MGILLLMTSVALTQPVDEQPPKFPPRQIDSSPVERAPKFSPRSAYQQCKLAVESGKKCKLYVGVAPPAIDAAELIFHIDSLPGVSTGVYDCWLENGVPMMRVCLNGT